MKRIAAFLAPLLLVLGITQVAVAPAASAARFNVVVGYGTGEALYISHHWGCSNWPTTCNVPLGEYRWVAPGQTTPYGEDWDGLYVPYGRDVVSLGYGPGGWYVVERWAATGWHKVSGNAFKYMAVVG